ncbi:MAG: hypothetical protein WC683_05315 [bacterium]
MVWYVIAGIAATAALGLLVVTFVRDRRYMKKKTSEAMSRELWTEIEEEREDGRQRQEKWQRALGEARKKG